MCANRFVVPRDAEERLPALEPRSLGLPKSATTNLRALQQTGVGEAISHPICAAARVSRRYVGGARAPGLTPPPWNLVVVEASHFKRGSSGQ